MGSPFFPEIEGYEIDHLLGKGGMGAVYKGRRKSDSRTVAIKFALPSKKNNENLAHRLRRELEVSSSFAHPYLAKVLDGDLLADNDGFYVVQEYLEGEDLSQILEKEQLDEKSCRRILGHMAEALSYLHDRALIHRDIKPSNIHITPEKRAVLLDFGLALSYDFTRLTDSDVMIGTFYYMAPELLIGSTADARSDIYALGATLFEGMTGKVPYDQKAILALIRGAQVEPLKAPAGPPRLTKLIMSMLAFDPALRPQNGTELLARVEKLDRAATETVTKAPKKVTPSRWPLIFLLLIPILLIVLALSPESKNPPALNPQKQLYEQRDKLLSAKSIPSKEQCAQLGQLLIKTGQKRRLHIRGVGNDEALGLYYLTLCADKRGEAELTINLLTELVLQHGPYALAKSELDPLSFLYRKLKGQNRFDKIVGIAEEYSYKVKETEEGGAQFFLAEALYWRSDNGRKSKIDLIRSRDILLSLRKKIPKKVGNYRFFKTAFRVLGAFNSEKARNLVITLTDEVLKRRRKFSDEHYIQFLARAASAITRRHRLEMLSPKGKKEHLKALQYLQMAHKHAKKTKSTHELGLLVESALITGRTGDTKEADRIYEGIDVDKLSRVDKFYYHKSYGTYLAERVRFNESLVELNKARMFANTERQTEDVKDQMASYKSLRALTGSK